MYMNFHVELSYYRRKRWEISLIEVDPDTELKRTISRLDITNLAPESFNRSTLVLQPRSLAYGIYEVIVKTLFSYYNSYYSPHFPTF